MVNNQFSINLKVPSDSNPTVTNCFTVQATSDTNFFLNLGDSNGYGIVTSSIPLTENQVLVVFVSGNSYSWYINDILKETAQVTSNLTTALITKNNLFINVAYVSGSEVYDADNNLVSTFGADILNVVKLVPFDYSEMVYNIDPVFYNNDLNVNTRINNYSTVEYNATFTASLITQQANTPDALATALSVNSSNFGTINGLQNMIPILRNSENFHYHLANQTSRTLSDLLKILLSVSFDSTETNITEIIPIDAMDVTSENIIDSIKQNITKFREKYGDMKAGYKIKAPIFITGKLTSGSQILDVPNNIYKYKILLEITLV